MSVRYAAEERSQDHREFVGSRVARTAVDRARLLRPRAVRCERLRRMEVKGRWWSARTARRLGAVERCAVGGMVWPVRELGSEALERARSRESKRHLCVWSA